ncbi:MAG: hypothetical protein AAGB12_08355 [Pseudomonadota bacterium]
MFLPQEENHNETGFFYQPELANIKLLETFFSEQYQRLPNTKELADLVSQWNLEEALFMEGLKQNLHINDSVIRQRIIEKVSKLEKSVLKVSEPSKKDLESWLHLTNQHNAKTSLVSFALYNNNKKAVTKSEATTTLKFLNDSEFQASLSNVSFYKSRYVDAIKMQFGDIFIEELLQKNPNEKWHLLPSTEGWKIAKLINREDTKNIVVLSDAKLLEAYKSAQIEKLFKERLNNIRMQFESLHL